MPRRSLLAGDQAFAFMGSGAFTGAAGQLRYQQISDFMIYASINRPQPAADG